MIEVMPEQVNNRNSIPYVGYLERHYPLMDIQKDIIEPILKERDFFVKNPNTKKIEVLNAKHLKDLDIWMSNLCYDYLYRQAAEKTENPGYGYSMGRESMIKHTPLLWAFGPMMSPKGIISRIPTVMREWNHTKEGIILENDKGHFRFALQHKPGIIVSDIALDYHLGLFDAAAEVAGIDGFETTLLEEKSNHPEGYFEFEGNYEFKYLPARAFYQYIIKQIPSMKRRIESERQKTIRFRESAIREKKARESFQKFGSRKLVDETLKGINPKLGLDKRYLSVMFSDIRDFTTISERLEGGELVKLLEDYFNKIVPAIEMHNGYVQTYIGDALMPIFENASDAVKGAIDMRFALREFNDHVMKNPEYTSKGLRFLRTGIGIATGETRHGITGTENRMQETVLGDSVNTGSRLEGLTKMYRVPIIIDGNTCDDLAMQGMIANPLEEGSLNQILSGEKILVRELDVVKPKGKNQELTIYEVIPRSYNREVLERRIGMNDLYSEAILLSRGKNPNTRSVRDSLNEAREIFSRISSAYPAGMGRKIAGMEEDQGGDYVCEQKIKELDELILRTETEPALFKKNGWYVKVFNGK